jgi:hypothetical protein
MSAETERIVRALAAESPLLVDDPVGAVGCLLCLDIGRPPANDEPEPHDPSCPWRLAREWVAKHPESGGEPSRLEGAAQRLLDGVTPFISALECEHGVDGEELYADLAEAIGLPRNYRPSD